jgi:transcriptional regulator with XRE-family HTH domain
MIRNDTEYQDAIRRLEGGEKNLAKYRAKLETEGLTPKQIDYAIGPSASLTLQAREEVTHYERMKRGDLDPIVNLHGMGPMLIAARIAAGVTQRHLAERLEVHESQISRDERNEYHGVTVERASRILDALGVTLTSALGVEAVRSTIAAPAGKTAWEHLMSDDLEQPAEAAPEGARPAAAGSPALKGKKKAYRALVGR